MISALYSAVSGLNANSTALDVQADNLANLNTPGFKGSTANFADAFNQSLNGVLNANQVGSGTTINSIKSQLNQGSIVSTGNPLDMAIDGNGFFVVNSPTQGVSYTRTGNFQVDSHGYVTTPDGSRLQGYASPNTASASLGDINTGNITSSAGATKNVSLSLNLNSQTPVNSSAFSIVNGQPTNYDFSTATTVYDSQGGAHDVTAYFTKTGANTWDINYGYHSGNSLVEATGKQTLSFDSKGQLLSDTSASAQPIQFDFGSATTSPQNITFKYGNYGQSGSQLSGTTQLAENSQVTGYSQDGFQPGAAKSVSIAADGTISAIFDNGQTTVLGKVALANFANPGGLTKVGNNFYVQSPTSGSPLINQAGSGGTGSVLSGSLETSNVDLADQLVSMDISKTAFSANIKTVQTTYEMMNDALSLKS